MPDSAADTPPTRVAVLLQGAARAALPHWTGGVTMNVDFRQGNLLSSLATCWPHTHVHVYAHTHAHAALDAFERTALRTWLQSAGGTINPPSSNGSSGTDGTREWQLVSLHMTAPPAPPPTPTPMYNVSVRSRAHSLWQVCTALAAAMRAGVTYDYVIVSRYDLRLRVRWDALRMPALFGVTHVLEKPHLVDDNILVLRPCALPWLLAIAALAYSGTMFHLHDMGSWLAARLARGPAATSAAKAAAAVVAGSGDGRGTHEEDASVAWSQLVDADADARAAAAAVGWTWPEYLAPAVPGCPVGASPVFELCRRPMPAAAAVGSRAAAAATFAAVGVTSGLGTCSSSVCKE